jgi:pimeloyl-ACP methyl ester carboxylesterase
MFFSKVGDSRIKEHSLLATKNYEKYLELSGYPGHYVKIPYEKTFLPGHFYRSPVAAKNAPLLIITPGRDTFAGDTCWVYDSAIRRGIHCLVYDGPGQGYALRLNNLTFRHDWENVVTPVIDFALTLDGIDPSRIGLMGLSFGGFLAPRAAAFEKRIKVLIADPGNISWGKLIAGRLEPISKLPQFMRPSFVDNMITDYAWKHGVTTKEIFNTLRNYDNSSVLDRITCETLVMDGTAEIVPGKAQEFFDALKCPKHYLLFNENTTSQSHCQMGSYGTGAEYLFDWVEEKL